MNGSSQRGGGSGRAGRLGEERVEGHDLVVEELFQLVLVQLFVCVRERSVRVLLRVQERERGTRRTVKLEVVGVERGRRRLVLGIVLRETGRVSAQPRGLRQGRGTYVCGEVRVVERLGDGQPLLRVECLCRVHS